MGTYDRLKKIIGANLMLQVERCLGGKLIRIRKAAVRVDLEEYRGKPLTLSAVTRIFCCSISQAKRIKKRLKK